MRPVGQNGLSRRRRWRGLALDIGDEGKLRIAEPAPAPGWRPL
jgi:hypothetical protein